MNDIVNCTGVLADLVYPHLVATEDFGTHLAFTETTVRTITEEAVAMNLERMDDELKAQVPID